MKRWLKNALTHFQCRLAQSLTFAKPENDQAIQSVQGFVCQCRHPGQCPSVHNGVTILGGCNLWLNGTCSTNTRPMQKTKACQQHPISSKCHHPGHNDRRYAMEEIFSNSRLQCAGGCLTNTRPMFAPGQSCVLHDHLNAARCLNVHPLRLTCAAGICRQFFSPIAQVVRICASLNAVRVEEAQCRDAGNIAKGQWVPQMPVHSNATAACLKRVLQDATNGLPQCHLEPQCKCAFQFLRRQSYHSILTSNNAAIRGTDIRAVMPLQLSSCAAS